MAECPGVSEIIVPPRFCGPSGSGNGGWTAGLLAGTLDATSPDTHHGGWPAVQVSLRQPPPLDTPLLLSQDDGTATASFEGAVVATAKPSDVLLSEVDPVSFDQARAAEATYAGHRFHPFPSCFVCGTAREEGDGMRIFPGLVRGDLLAATWQPYPDLAEDSPTGTGPTRHASLAATWAALDCIGGWAGDLTERLMVLGRMTARIDALPVIDEPHVVVGTRRGVEGRKTFTASTLYDSDQRIVAAAEHIWIAVDPALFGGETPS